MRRLFGGRTAIEAVFLIAVPIVSLAAGLSALGIIVAAVVGYGLVLVFEAVLARDGLPQLPFRPQIPQLPRRRPETRPLAGPPVVDAEEEFVQPLPRPVSPPRSEPEPEPASAHEREPEPESTLEPPRAPEPEPEAEADAEPDAAPALYAVPQSDPEVEVEPAPEPALEAELEPQLEAGPEPETAVPIGVSAIPRQWNVWELERLTRESSGLDLAEDEERRFLLLYLREFADPNGVLPIDFDGLVRESFGHLVGAG